jgi:hypothetical protein
VGDEVLGPIDYLAVEWRGGHVTGEGFRLLSPDMGDKLAQLRQLGELRASGVLTDTGFEGQKARILGA